MSAKPTSAESDVILAGAPDRAELEVEPSMVSGRRIGRYVVSRRVGLGGMGAVYEAFDPELERRVAIKVLRRAAVRRAGSSLMTRMIREAQSLARLSHPNVVPVYDVGVEYGRMWVAMEFVVGHTMRQWLAEPRPWSEVLRVAIAAGRGLIAVHEAGLVHRDFKPSNVLIGDDGRVRITDFGLARAQGTGSSETSTGARSESASASASAPAGFLDVSITRTGTTIGTPPYMAPEQHAGAYADAASDQFAFCVTLYEALWGRRPFSGASIVEIERAKREGDVPVPPPGSEAPARLWPIVRRGLSPDPARRWPSMQALVQALEDVGPRRRRVWPAVVALVVVAGLGWAIRSDDPATCGDAEDMLRTVWNERRQAAVREILEGSDVPYAPRTAVLVQRRVDEHARRWVEARRDTCAVAAVEGAHGEAVARLACLDDRLQELDALLSVLERGQEKAVEGAARSVAQLRGIEACSERSAEKLYRTPLEDPSVQAVRRELHRAHALARAGEVQEAALLAEEALMRARELDDSVLLVEALTEAGQIRGSSSRVEEGEAALQEAALLAESIGYDELAAQAAIELAGLLGATRARLDAAQWWARRAESALERLGRPRLMQARLHDAQGLIALEEGELAVAFEHFEAQLELTRSGEQATRFAEARALDRLATAALRAGRVADARAYNREALALMVDEVGEDHPAVGWVVLDAARIATRAGDLETALERHERAREIFTAALGPDSTEAMYAASELAVVLDMLGRPEEALSMHEEAIARLEARQGTHHPDLAVAWGNLGASLGGLGRLEEAVEALERSLEINERAFGHDHAATAFSHNSLGIALEQLDRDEEARRHLDRALRIKEQVFDPDHPEIAYTLANLAVLDRKAGDRIQARGRFRHASGLLDIPDDPDPVGLARMLAELAELELETDEPAAALAAAERALELFERTEAPEEYPARAREVIARAANQLSRDL